MILYIVHDDKQNTYSHPLIAPDLETVQVSFEQMNPENIDSLLIIPLLNDFKTLPDLISLLQKINKKTLPDSIKLQGRDSSNAVMGRTQQPKGVSASKKAYKYDDPEWQREASIRSKKVWAQTKKNKHSSAKKGAKK